MLFRFRRLFTFIFLLLFSLCGLFAGGAQEDRLETAKKLMALKDYNAAVEILKQLSIDDPDRFEQAEQLLWEIRNIQSLSVEKTKQSIEAIKKGDLEGALALMNESESMIPNPNASTAKDQKNLKKTINFRVSLARFNALMADAKAFMDRQAWGQAAQKYLEGYNFHREDFNEAEYGNILKAQVLSSLTDLEAAANTFISQEAEFRKILQQGIALISSTSSGEMNQKMVPLLDTWKSLANLKTRIFKSAQVFKSQYNLVVQAKGIDNKDLFLDYNVNVTRGRLGVNWEEGLYKSLDMFWSQGMTQWSDGFKKRLEEAFSLAESSWNQGDFLKAQEEFTQVYDISLIALKTQSTWNQSLVSQKGDQDEFSLDSYRSRLARLWFFQSLGILAAQGRRVTEIEQSLKDLTQDSLSSQELLLGARLRLQEAKQIYRGFIASLTLKTSEFAAFPSPAWNLEQSPQSLQRFSNLWARAVDRLNTREISLVMALGGLEFVRLNQEYESLATNQRENIQLLSGKDELDTQRFPQQALEAFQSQDIPQTALRTRVVNFVEKYRQETLTLGNPRSLQNRVDEGSRLLDRMNTLITLRGTLAKQASDEYNRNVSLRRDAANIQSNIGTLIDQNRFNEARQSLNNYSIRVSEALALQTDQVYKTQADQNYTDLITRLNEKENIIVVRDVLALLRQGRAAYDDLRFTQAQDFLNQAANRWKVTNDQPNPDITKWQEYIKSALTVSADREIFITDALYPVIQQLINFAKRALDLAERSQNTPAQRQALLNEAVGHLSNVKMVYARNQEARILELRVALLQDPANAQSRLNTYFTTAVSRTQESSRTVMEQGYGELQDLKGINPNFPGLQAAMNEVEFKLGLRIRPPDPAKLRESRNLTNRAKGIYDSSNLNQFGFALTLVRDALVLDPNNAEAEEYKILLSAATGATSVGISPSDQAILNKVVDLMANQSYRQAQVEFNKLDVNGKYRTNAEIQDIKLKLANQ